MSFTPEELAAMKAADEEIERDFELTAAEISAADRRDEQFRGKPKYRYPERQRAYYQEHREEILAYQKDYRKERKEQISEYKRRYYQENKEAVDRRSRKWAAEHRDKHNEYMRRYRAAHLEQCREAVRRWQREHKGGSKMTIEDVRASGKPFLTPAEAAGVLGCDPQYIRVQARDKPEALGFPVCRIGTRTRIPREPFLEFVGG